MSKYEQPGKFFVDGLLLGTPATPESLKKGLSYQFTSKDVMVTGYPKSGKYYQIICFSLYA